MAKRTKAVQSIPIVVRAEIDPSMLIATAGHVDHGKTTLVRALTGTDCDRLEEEKRRGITIVLGYAEWTLPSGRKVSLIDVPGHERLVRTMLSGAGGLDAVVVAISAVAGVMPQTREHLNACALLGVTEAVVAMTFTDKVDDEKACMRMVREGLRSTPFPDAPIVPVSAISGVGVDALGARVDSIFTGRSDIPKTQLAPCLPIDRDFSIDGFGTVVTGSLLRGSLTVGQTVELMPGRVETRVRGLQVHGDSREQAIAPCRVALNLTCARDAIPSGALVSEPNALHVGRVFDAEIEWLAHAKRPLKRRRGLSFHIASTSAVADVQTHTPILPGQRGAARVRLDRPVCLPPGFRFVLRGGVDVENGAVIGGGRVLDPSPPRRRLTVARETLRSPVLDLVVKQLVAESKRRGISAAELARRLPIPPPEVDTLRFDPDWIRREVDRLVQITASYHRAHPMEAGVPQAQLTGEAISKSALEQALQRQLLIAEKGRIASPAHKSQLDPALDRMARKVMRAVGRAGLAALSIDQIVARFPAGQGAVRAAIRHLKAQDRVVVVGVFCFPAREVLTLRSAVAHEALIKDNIRVNWLKSMYGVSRKHAIPLWTWLDGCGTTVREGDVRIAGPRAKEHADD